MSKNYIAKLKTNAKKLKNEIVALSLALKDKRTPLLAKVMIGLTVGYALSPIDLIPDFIPIVGYLDDLILLPFLIMLTIKLIPQDVMDDCRKRAQDNYKLSKKSGFISAAIIILIWLVILALILLKFFKTDWVKSNILRKP